MNLNYETDEMHNEELCTILFQFINELDKRIFSLENKIQNRIFDNIKCNDTIENLKVPIVYKQTSDFVKETNLKKKINGDIKIKNNIINLLEIKQEKEKIEIENRKIKFLKEQLRLVDEDSKDYLRHLEAYNFDYSNVNDKKEREIIKKLIKEFYTLKKMRKKLMKLYKKSNIQKKYTLKKYNNEV